MKNMDRHIFNDAYHVVLRKDSTKFQALSFMRYGQVIFETSMDNY